MDNNTDLALASRVGSSCPGLPFHTGVIVELLVLVWYRQLEVL